MPLFFTVLAKKYNPYDIDNGITLCVKHHKAADRGEIDRGRLRELAAEPVSPPRGLKIKKRTP